VSIAKAGITTTLNTRATLLAAANPAWGRYDVRRSPAENIALPAALLSRFDLMWLILDRADPDGDRALAAHVLEVHATGAAPTSNNRGGEGEAGGAAAAGTAGTTQTQTQNNTSSNFLPPAVLRAYVARAKQCSPSVPESLTEYIAAVYAEMRAEEAAASVPHSYTTARTLLSILRLAQALARLRFAEQVGQAEVDEALRLMRMSKHSLLDDAYTGGNNNNAARARADPTSAIYGSIRDDAQRTRRLTYRWDDLVALLGRRFTHEQIRESVEEYANYGVFSLEYPRPNEPTVVIAQGDLAGGV
jgi:DNA replication licensing factor MCM7